MVAQFYTAVLAKQFLIVVFLGHTSTEKATVYSYGLLVHQVTKNVYSSFNSSLKSFGPKSFEKIAL